MNRTTALQGVSGSLGYGACPLGDDKPGASLLKTALRRGGPRCLLRLEPKS